MISSTEVWKEECFTVSSGKVTMGYDSATPEAIPHHANTRAKNELQFYDEGYAKARTGDVNHDCHSRGLVRRNIYAAWARQHATSTAVDRAACMLWRASPRE
ncbi:hypothetical protein Y032_0499g2551 [Ancylostoma ceylanicum]|uniref:Uncharacterized protein n=1 Tax=Ancylostoma ceylanicum TaxID=53326 RepID=A0A016WU68_9BILA|nr:hypothetical protein Y032_0499g2551 [Ancylostoma ceylanicum]